MNKLLITGATGFIGGFLIKEALDRKFNVFAFVRKSSSIKTLESQGVQCIEIDMNNIDQQVKYLKEFNFDYIIHNAGITRSANKQDYYDVNCGYLQNIVTAIEHSQINIKKFIFMSSLAALGSAENQVKNILDEDAIPKPLTTYGKSKLAAENFLKTKTNIPFIIFRLTAVFGPNEKDLFQTFKLSSQGIQLNPSSAHHDLTFIYVKDVCRLVFDAINSEHFAKTYNVSDGNVYSNNEFYQFIAKAFNKKVISLNLPIPIVKIYAILGELIGKITGKFPLVHQEKVLELEATSWACDIAPLKKDFNFKPKYTLETAVHETTEWYKSNNWL